MDRFVLGLSSRVEIGYRRKRSGLIVGPEPLEDTNAEARLARSRDIIAATTDHLAADETVFLHPTGVDAECDEARASPPT